jgi:hypothetical protein
MRPYASLTDEQLVEEYASAKAYADELYARLDKYKEELQLRFNESGQLKFECPTHEVTMKREPFSAAWLERVYGFTKAEIPQECYTEKVSLTLDAPAVQAWVLGQNMDWRETYTPSIKAKPMKA